MVRTGDRDCDIQEINRCGYLRSGFNCWMEVAEQVNEFFKLISGHLSYSHSVINVSHVRLGKLTLTYFLDQVHQVTHEEPCMAEAHFCSHGNTTKLVPALTIKINFMVSTSSESSSGDCRLDHLIPPKQPLGHQMRNRCIERTYTQNEEVI